MGHPHKECLILSHEELFLPLFERLPVLDMAALLPEIRRQINEGRYREAMHLVIDKAVEAGYPADFVMTDPSHPAFDLLLDHGSYDESEKYTRSVNFATGEAAIQFLSSNGTQHLRRSFVSRADGVLVVELMSDHPLSVEVYLGIRPFTLEAWEAGRTSEGYVPKGQFVQRGIRSIESYAYNESIVYRSAYALTPGGYEGVCRVVPRGGETTVHGAGLRVRDAESVLILCTVKPLEDFVDSALPRLQSKLSTMPEGYEELLARHLPIHADLFERVRLDLSSDDEAATPLEDQIREARETSPSPAFVERLFDACRYIVICSTGTLPPNLQGVWACTWTPHWSGDYTLDANVEAAVAHMLACGTPELMITLFNLMDRFVDDFRENARRLYGARGIFLNSRVSTTGLQQRYNTCPVYFWTAGAAWIAHYYWEYYLYTGDKVFLLDRALPFMKEVALFYEDFLEMDGEGVYRFSPSWSPENHAANTGSPVAINATMDIAACKELFSNLIAVCLELGIDEELIPVWRDLIARLPPYLANVDGALKEWASLRFEDRYSHRHMSHLYPLYPGREADPDADPELFRMAQRAVEKRLEHYDGKDYGAFGLYHASIAASRCGDSLHAWEALTYLARWHVYSGLGTAHNSGPEIFNVDMAGGYPAAVIEMLVSASPGRIRLLPAIPVEWKSGSIDGIRCPGQVTISHLSWDLGERRVEIGLESIKDTKVEIVLPDRSRTSVIIEARRRSDLVFHWSSREIG